MASRPSTFPLTSPGRLRLYTNTELIKLPPPEYLVDHMLHQGGLCVLFGQPGTYKSFLAADIAMSVASNRAWHGEAVRGGPVLYVSAEGGGGMSKRSRAWSDYWKINPALIDIAWLIEPMIVQPDSGDVDRLMERVFEAAHEPTLIVIDTLARCFDGDENQQEDMGRFVAGVDRLRHELKTTVLVVHHTRLDGDRERGNTSLRGAADTMLSLRRPKKKGTIIKLEVDKQKDAEEGGERTLQFVVVPNPDPLWQSGVIVSPQGTGRGAELMIALQSQAVSSETGYTLDELRRLSGMSRPTFFRSLKEARNTGLITTRGERHFVSSLTESHGQSQVSEAKKPQ